jgi:hypothetical protein
MHSFREKYFFTGGAGEKMIKPELFMQIKAIVYRAND